MSDHRTTATNCKKSSNTFETAWELAVLNGYQSCKRTTKGGCKSF